MRQFLLLTILLLLATTSFAKKDSLSLAKMDDIKYKNVIKWNPTPMILWSSKNLTFSYERIISPRNSFSITLGYLELPDLLSDSILNVVSINNRNKRGFNFSAEYRFYLTSRNARAVPDGVYIAPYFSHYNYHFKNDMDIRGNRDSSVVFKGDLYAANLGFELGYQFVFKKRFTLDLVLFGPSFSYYMLNVGISGNANLEGIGANINEDFYNKLKERFPSIGNDVEYEKQMQYKGRASAFTGGFRYLVQFGYRF